MIIIARGRVHHGGYLLGNHPGGTNALSKNTLTTDNQDSVYRLGYSFIHSAETVVFRFSATGLESLANES
jgi:hypothetical protein